VFELKTASQVQTHNVPYTTRWTSGHNLEISERVAYTVAMLLV